VRPELVAEIAFAEWTQNGLLRQPRYEGLRPDKAPRECRRERPKATTQDLSDAEADMPTTKTKRAPRSLAEYRAKRDFRATPEPAPAPARAHKQPIFVVQEHHATRLHYDFRLEDEGMLKSWAVTKEPSRDPSVKRLAVRVEDHPLAYAGFAGSIPEGHYGAGTVTVWDRGTYENADSGRSVAEGLDAGRLSVILHGDKLRGRYALVRMRGKGRGKENWLLIKSRDEYARADAAGDGAPARRTIRRKSTATAPRVSTADAPPPGGVKVSHPEKVLFPDAEITKGEVFEYYRKVAPRLLPFLRDRPVTLERLPDGLGAGKPHFWQKNTPASYPSWIPRVELPSERGRAVHYVLVNDEDTLLYLVNQGALTFHPFLSRVGSLDRPDFVLFDLDPGTASFANAVAVARQIHAELDDEGRESMVKTSGKTGLHVLTPWREAGDFDAARAWALRVAERVVSALPEVATLEVRKAKRRGRVYVDVVQNARGHHAVPPYVVRAVPGAPVSMPLSWRELRDDLDPKRFNVRTAAARLARQKHDPIAGLLGAPE
jgi:bifunctional non-homologous end joining protein LigD